MQNPSHTSTEEKFAMNFSAFDPELFGGPHMGAAMGGMGVGMKRSAHDAGLDREPLGLSSDDDDLLNKDNKLHQSSGSRDMLHHHTNLDQHGAPPNQQQQQQAKQSILPNGKKTKGRVKIKMEFIDNKLRRYTTFSKRKTGIMKKAYELSTLTGTQVMLLVASETGHVYTFATRKLQPMITSDAGKALIQTCLNSPDPPPTSHHHHDQRMSATGYEETELTYAVTEDEQKDDLNCREDCLAANGSSSPPTDSSSPPSPSTTSASPIVSCSSASTAPGTAAQALHAGAAAAAAAAAASVVKPSTSLASTAHGLAPQTMTLPPGLIFASQVTGVPTVTGPSVKAENTTKTSTVLTGGSVVLGGTGGQVVYATGGGLVYAPQGRLGDTTAAPMMFNVPQTLQVAHDHGTGSGGTGQLVTLPVALSSTALQQTAAAVAAVSSTQKVTGSQALPTDLSMHIKREDKE